MRTLPMLQEVDFLRRVFPRESWSRQAVASARGSRGVVNSGALSGCFLKISSSRW